MLSRFLSRILTNCLSDYVRRVDGQRLEVALWDGDVVLTDLELVERSFVGLGSDQFLVKVDQGHIGKLRVHVPWNALSTGTVSVELCDVCVLLKEDQHAPRKHIAEEIKRAKLAVWDSIARWRMGHVGVPDASKGLFSPDRMRITVHNLHIRYEDELTDPGHPFACGVRVARLDIGVMTPSDEHDIPCPGHPVEAGARMERQLLPHRECHGQGVAMYLLSDTAAYRPPAAQPGESVPVQQQRCRAAFAKHMQLHDEHPWLITPVAGIVRVSFGDECTSLRIVQASHVRFEVSMRQLRDINALRLRIGGASERRLIEGVRRRHPYVGNKNLRTLGGVKLWKQLWWFAGQCVLALRRRYRPDRLTWKKLRSRRQQRIDYIKLYAEAQLESFQRRTASSEVLDATHPSRIDVDDVVEQALLGRLHPILHARVKAHSTAAPFALPKQWVGPSDTQRKRGIEELEASMTVADIHLYRKIATFRVLEAALKPTTTPLPRGCRRRASSSTAIQTPLTTFERQLLEKIRDFEPEVTLQRFVRTRAIGHFLCSGKLSGFHPGDEQLDMDFGMVNADMKLFGSMMDSLDISTSDLTVNLKRNTNGQHLQRAVKESRQPIEVCIPIIRSIDKVHEGGRRVVLSSSSTCVGVGQGLNVWDKGINQRDISLTLNSIDVSFDCRAHDTLYGIYVDLCTVVKNEWQEREEPPERRWLGTHRSQSVNANLRFGHDREIFPRDTGSSRQSSFIVDVDRSASGSSEAHIAHLHRLPKGDPALHAGSEEMHSLESAKIQLLHAAWKAAVRKGLTDRDAVRIMLEHLRLHECTAEYYLYMWLQRLHTTRRDLDQWMDGLPQFDTQLLDELHLLCEDGTKDSRHKRQLHVCPPIVPAVTHSDTAKRDGRKVMRVILQAPKISISAHSNDPQSPTVLITADKLECRKQPASFFRPDFVDSGDVFSYYDTLAITLSRQRVFVASRDYLYH
eukprot:COSAG01_NODE_7848_length_3027_cov_10.447746_1_plen_966_part_01